MFGVYVHFPWCLAKCPYCDFLSVAERREAIPHRGYADAVLAELRERAAGLDAVELGTVFFGGGTPSLWREGELGRVLDGIFAAFPRRTASVEVTVECNPTSFDADKARALRDVGVNRVSIGVQGLDPGRLSFLGRLHRAEDGLCAVGDALRAGVPRVSADLIYGVAGQAPEQAASEARRVAELGVTHLSAYQLTIEPGTAFGALAKKGKLPLLGEELEVESFLAVASELRALGFEQYEISNFAREGHRCEHNLGYWRGHDYLGLGCAAWGTVTLRDGTRRRYRNTPSPGVYLRHAEGAFAAWSDRPGELVSDVESLDAHTALAERIMLGLRLEEGVDIERAAARLGVEPWPEPRALARDRLLARGLVVRDSGVFRIPQHSWLFADRIAAELM